MATNTRPRFDGHELIETPVRDPPTPDITFEETAGTSY